MTSHTLLLRLTGPFQSWGSRSRFGERDTEREPTKSGVVGLLCAALGRSRDADLRDLASLRMGVRVDREGRIERDYQTALDVRKADPKALRDTVLSNRYYLADAAFLVGFESEGLSLLEKIDAALMRPCWTMFLGRKAFVPGEPVRLPDGLRRAVALEDALRAYPLVASGTRRSNDEDQPLRLMLECPSREGGELRADVPLSFVSDKREFAVRHVTTIFVPRPQRTDASEDECS